MGEMVERVARLLATQVARHIWEELPNSAAIYPNEIDLYIDVLWKHHEEDARAVIEAMRAPTEAMIRSGDSNAPCSIYDPDTVWEKMINEALK